MSGGLERMLAEGPRVAPEPPVVPDGGGVVAPGLRGPGRSRVEARRARGTKAALGRLWLPLLLAAIVVSTSATHGYAWVVAVAFAGFAAFRAWRLR